MEKTQEYFSTVSDEVKTTQLGRSGNSSEDRSMSNSRQVDSSEQETDSLKDKECSKCGSISACLCSCQSVSDSTMSEEQQQQQCGSCSGSSVCSVSESDDVLDVCCDDNNKSITTTEPTLESSFPWIVKFKEMCFDTIFEPSIKGLDELMQFYIVHVSADVKACYMKPNRAAKLKKSLGDVLTFFYIHYNELKPVENSFYLSKMSNLLSFYMDMEIKASRRGKESVKKISSKLLTSLYLLLDKSVDHILDAILNSRLMIKSFREICIPILRRVLNDVPSSRSIIYTTSNNKNVMTYVRCVLAFKLWKRVVRGADQRRQINKLAISQLQPAPANLREIVKSGVLNGILPNIPKSRTDITQFLIQAKFNAKAKSQDFLKLVRKSSQFELLTDSDRYSFFNEDIDNQNFKSNDKTTSSVIDNCGNSDGTDAGSFKDVTVSDMSDMLLNQQKPPSNSSIYSLIDDIIADVRKSHRSRHARRNHHNNNISNFSASNDIHNNIYHNKIDVDDDGPKKKKKMKPFIDKLEGEGNIRKVKRSLSKRELISAVSPHKPYTSNKAKSNRRMSTNNMDKRKINSKFKTDKFKNKNDILPGFDCNGVNIGDKQLNLVTPNNRVNDGVATMNEQSSIGPQNCINSYNIKNIRTDGNSSCENQRHSNLVDGGRVAVTPFTNVPQPSSLPPVSSASLVPPVTVSNTTPRNLPNRLAGNVVSNEPVNSSAAVNYTENCSGITNQDIERVDVKLEPEEELDKPADSCTQPTFTEQQNMVITANNNNFTNSNSMAVTNIDINVVVKQEDPEMNRNVAQTFLQSRPALLFCDQVNMVNTNSISTMTYSEIEDELADKLRTVLFLQENEKDKLLSEGNNKLSSSKTFCCFTRDRKFTKKRFAVKRTLDSVSFKRIAIIKACVAEYVKSSKKSCRQNCASSSRDKSKGNIFLTLKNNSYIMDRNSLELSQILTPCSLRSCGPENPGKVFVGLPLKKPMTSNKDVLLLQEDKVKQFVGGSYNSSLINEIMQKYSSIFNSNRDCDFESVVSKSSMKDDDPCVDHAIPDLDENRSVQNTFSCDSFITEHSRCEQPVLELNSSQQRPSIPSKETKNINCADDNNTENITETLPPVITSLQGTSSSEDKSLLSVNFDSLNHFPDRINVMTSQDASDNGGDVNESTNVLNYSEDSFSQNKLTSSGGDSVVSNEQEISNIASDLSQSLEKPLDIKSLSKNYCRAVNKYSSGLKHSKEKAVSFLCVCDNNHSPKSDSSFKENCCITASDSRSDYKSVPETNERLLDCNTSEVNQSTGKRPTSTNSLITRIDPYTLQTSNRSNCSKDYKNLTDNLNCGSLLSSSGLSRDKVPSLSFNDIDRTAVFCKKSCSGGDLNYGQSVNDCTVPDGKLACESRINALPVTPDGLSNDVSDSVIKSEKFSFRGTHSNVFEKDCVNNKLTTKEVSVQKCTVYQESFQDGKLIIDEESMYNDSAGVDEEISDNIPSELVMDISAVAQEVEITSEPKEDPMLTPEDPSGVSRINSSNESKSNADNYDEKDGSGIVKVKIKKDESLSQQSCSQALQDNEKKVPSIKITIKQNKYGVQRESDFSENSSKSNSDSVFVCESTTKIKRAKNKRKHKDRQHHSSKHRSRTVSREDSECQDTMLTSPDNVKESDDLNVDAKHYNIKRSEDLEGDAKHLPSNKPNEIAPANEIENMNATSLEADKLHTATCDLDHSLCQSQFKFREFYSQCSFSLSIPVPYPPHAQQCKPGQEKPPDRCPCDQCTKNLSVLIANYDKLIQYRNARLKDDVEYRKHQEAALMQQMEQSINENNDTNNRSDASQCSAVVSLNSPDHDCSLPLKKRKTLTHLACENSCDNTINAQGQENIGINNSVQNKTDHSQQLLQESRKHHHRHRHHHHHHRVNGKHSSNSKSRNTNSLNGTKITNSFEGLDIGEGSCSNSSNSTSSQDNDLFYKLQKRKEYLSSPSISDEPLASPSLPRDSLPGHSFGSTGKNTTNDANLAAETLLNLYNMKQKKLKSDSFSSQRDSSETDSSHFHDDPMTDVDSNDNQQHSAIKRDLRIRNRSRKNAVR